jgi:predicted metal-dependent hydrolase
VKSSSKQLSLPLVGSTSTAADEFLVGVSRPVPVRFARHPRARRYVLRVDDDGVARVTMPRWGRRSDARAFAAAHIAWIERQRAAQFERRPKARAIAPGASILVRGVPHPLEVSAVAGDIVLRLGDLQLRKDWSRPLDESVLVGLKQLARRELPIRLRELAAECGLSIERVSIRDQRTRWGSCAPSGRISLNWRLVQMPSDVRDYVLYHELMHLRVRNHSPRFWQQVARVCPRYQEARRWLREHAHRLL